MKLVQNFKQRFRRTYLYGVSGLGLLVALLFAGCASEHPLNTLTSDSSPDAERINNLFFPILGVAILVGILVLGGVVFMMFRFRSKRVKGESKADPYDPDNPHIYVLDVEDLPEQIHGNNKLEIAWTIIPTLILLIISIFTLITLFEINDVDAEDDALKVTVVGQQWWWEFQYHMDGNLDSSPDFVTANELVIPVNERVVLQVEARDVIHAFWIPRLNGKVDAVPGREHDWVIEARESGRYAGQCTEFCGLSHGFMKMQTIAVEPAVWTDWAANQKQLAAPKQPSDEGYEGEQLFMANCARCHSVAGVTDTNDDDAIDTFGIYDGDKRVNDELISGAAPNLTHFASRVSFAGSIFDIYEDEAKNVPYENVAEFGDLNSIEIRDWILDAPSLKEAAANESRGMPSFPNLSRDEASSIVEYLATLK